MRFHEDDRRAFWGDIFGLPNGDVNIVKLKPGITIAWHRHHWQDDHVLLWDGDVLLQAIDRTGKRHSWEMAAPRNAPELIPRGWWHGYGTKSGAILLQFNGPGKWDGNDEERKAITDMPW